MTANENPHDHSTMNQQQRHQFTNSGRPVQGLLAKVLAFVLSVGLFALAFIFSLAALAVVAVVGVIFAGWLWWKTRAVRRHMHAMRTAPDQAGGHIIEGEVIREAASTPAASGRLLP